MAERRKDSKNRVLRNGESQRKDGTYMYRYTFLNSKYGLGAAVGVFNSAVNIFILVTVNGLFRRFSEDSLW